METNALGGVSRPDRTTRLKGDQFDPAVLDGTVDDVLDYIAKNPAHADAVLAAEAKGKGRKGIVESGVADVDDGAE